LLPGFLAARLEQKLTVKRVRTELDKIVEASLYSFLIYLIYSSLTKSFPVTIRDTIAGQTHNYTLDTNPGLLAALAGIAVAMAILKSYVANHDLLGKLFRRLRISQKSWRDSTWSDVFHNYGEAVQVQLADGRSIVGWLKHYSDEAEDGCIFLERAAWVAEDELIQIDGPGILLSKNSEVSSVTFLHWKPSEQPGMFKGILS
jgi:hypothetical protein